MRFGSESYEGRGGMSTTSFNAVAGTGVVSAIRKSGGKQKKFFGEIGVDNASRSSYPPAVFSSCKHEEAPCPDMM
jgi:hypothetical protein